MPWVIGIDEAGYGPNLGPFVMTSVACRVPEELAGADLWRALRPAVRRHKEADDGRLLIEDSKLVYSAARGMIGLETGVLALLGGRSSSPATRHPPPATLLHLLGAVCPAAGADLCQECWFTGATPLPFEAAAADLGEAAGRFADACAEARLSWGLVRSVLVCPARFNAVLDRWGSKGVVLGLALAELLRANHRPDAGADAVAFHIDKHGGRNNYAALLQQAVPEGMVLAEEEGPERSVYRVAGLPREVRLTFTPRADAAHLCVALASMVSKYLRELLMAEFNRFWQGHVPGLKATAGYPGDAARFFADIRPAVARLDIPEAALWRRK
jgi:ribonuclease HII